MNPKFQQLEERYAQAQHRLADPAIQGTAEYNALAREFKRLEPAAAKAAELRRVEADIEKSQPLLQSNEADLRALVEEELTTLRARETVLNRELEEFLLPRDPQDERDVIVEIRAGTGGDEAALFAGDLYRMYTRYAADHGLAVEPYSSSPTGLGGYKEIIFGLRGLGAYGRFKNESGVHRVQRVPQTESQGRI
ncbi:MAG TPA: PCRF domain-containing protein, partial [Elusimicrobiota bacterium]|nr:PCRF domain-containing protein [Elusimicrobiota bacterium]